jgi:uncharacterized protein (TIGR02588 family)
MPAEDSRKREIPLIEKMIAGLGLLLVLLVSGSLGYEALRHTGGPPDIEVQVSDIRRGGSGYLVRFNASNSGETTGAQVHVQGQLWKGEEVIEVSIATLTYVPDGGNQEGGLFFDRDPQDYRLVVRATGYEKP